MLTVNPKCLWNMSIRDINNKLKEDGVVVCEDCGWVVTSRRDFHVYGSGLIRQVCEKAKIEGGKMIIKLVTGDLLQSEAQTIVNPVNCFGAMGRGIALKFKKKYPEMFKDYVIKCNTGELQIGKPYVIAILLHGL